MERTQERMIRQLTKILEMETAELGAYLSGKLFEVYGKDLIYTTEDYIYAKGEIPVALIAHMDTVHNVPAVEIMTEGILTSSTGLGADDRAGVYAILHLLDLGYRPSVIFLNYEESGGIGATEFVKRMKKDKRQLGVNFMVEFDRKNANDAVYYNCDNSEFETFINSFGFKTAWGSFSDISIIAPWAKIAAVNLSVGYYFQHTRHEILVLADLMNTLKKAEKMLQTETKPFVYMEVQSGWEYYYTSKKSPKKSAKKTPIQLWRDDMLHSVEGKDMLDSYADEHGEEYAQLLVDDETLHTWQDEVDRSDEDIIKQLKEAGDLTEEDWKLYHGI